MLRQEIIFHSSWSLCQHPGHILLSAHQVVIGSVALINALLWIYCTPFGKCHEILCLCVLCPSCPNFLTLRSRSSNAYKYQQLFKSYFFSHFASGLCWHFFFTADPSSLSCLSCFSFTVLRSQWWKLTALKSWNKSPATAFSDKKWPHWSASSESRRCSDKESCRC